MPAEIIPQPVDLITIDVSFISLKIVVPAVIKFMKKAGKVFHVNRLYPLQYLAPRGTGNL
jgi:predicted rRNA methylase YqxC with S4 and FtsJ domains